MPCTGGSQIVRFRIVSTRYLRAHIKPTSEPKTVIIPLGRIGGCVRRHCPCRTQRGPCGNVFIHIGHLHFNDFSTLVREDFHASTHRFGKFNVNVVCRIVLVKPDTNTCDALPYSLKHIGDRIRQRGGVVRIEPSNRLKHNPRISNTSRHWTDMIHRFGKREHTVAADSPPRWFQTDNSACR